MFASSTYLQISWYMISGSFTFFFSFLFFYPLFMFSFSFLATFLIEILNPGHICYRNNIKYILHNIPIGWHGYPEAIGNQRNKHWSDIQFISVCCQPERATEYVRPSNLYLFTQHKVTENIKWYPMLLFCDSYVIKWIWIYTSAPSILQKWESSFLILLNVILRDILILMVN